MAPSFIFFELKIFSNPTCFLNRWSGALVLGYGSRLMFWRSWVWISVLYTRWTYSRIWVVKIVMFVWKDEHKQKKAGKTYLKTQIRWTTNRLKKAFKTFITFLSGVNGKRINRSRCSCTSADSRIEINMTINNSNGSFVLPFCFLRNATTPDRTFKIPENRLN